MYRGHTNPVKIAGYSFLFLAVVLFLSRTHLRAYAMETPQTGHCITRYENGRVDWTTGKIAALGYAFPMENEPRFADLIPGAARADANRNLINILKNIQLSNAVKVGDHASKNDTVLAGIEKTARDAVILRQYYTSALSLEMLVETSIFGGFLQLVLPEDIRQIPSITVENKNPAGSSPPSLHTGLIINAKGLEFKPVLNPVIVSEQGQDVYSAAFISREFAVQKGVCKYLCSLEAALKDDRTGENPIVIKGLRKDGNKNSVIVINMTDFRHLETMSERHLFLKECRVIIVMDL